MELTRHAPVSVALSMIASTPSFSANTRASARVSLPSASVLITYHNINRVMKTMMARQHASISQKSARLCWWSKRNDSSLAACFSLLFCSAAAKRQAGGVMIEREKMWEKKGRGGK